MDIDVDMSILSGPSLSQTMLDRLKTYDELGQKIYQNRFKNGATWCQNGLQDGLLSIRAVKRRSWTAAPTAAPIAATTTTTKKDGDGGGADLTVIIIVIVVGVVVVICCVVGALLVVVGVVVVKSQNTEGAQKPARPAASEEQKTLAPEEISLEEAKPNAHFSL